MSVNRSQRSTSDMEYLSIARKLEIFTIQKCVGFPKRYTFYLTEGISDLAKQVYIEVKAANSIFPQNQHEAQLRRDHLISAYCALQNLISQIEIAQEMFGIQPDALCHWMELIDSELRLVKAVMKSDRERYKSLP